MRNLAIVRMSLVVALFFSMSLLLADSVVPKVGNPALPKDTEAPILNTVGFYKIGSTGLKFKFEGDGDDATFEVIDCSDDVVVETGTTEQQGNDIVLTEDEGEHLGTIFASGGQHWFEHPIGTGGVEIHALKYCQ